MTTMFLDDVRMPRGRFDVIVRSSQEAIDHISKHGVPDFISFDHDLGGDDDAMRVVNFIIESDLDGDISIPSGFSFHVHSANPIGARNILSKLENYLRMKH